MQGRKGYFVILYFRDLTPYGERVNPKPSSTLFLPVLFLVSLLWSENLQAQDAEPPPPATTITYSILEEVPGIEGINNYGSAVVWSNDDDSIGVYGLDQFGEKHYSPLLYSSFQDEIYPYPNDIADDGSIIGHWSSPESYSTRDRPYTGFVWRPEYEGWHTGFLGFLNDIDPVEMNVAGSIIGSLLFDTCKDDYETYGTDEKAICIGCAGGEDILTGGSHSGGQTTRGVAVNDQGYYVANRVLLAPGDEYLGSVYCLGSYVKTQAILGDPFGGETILDVGNDSAEFIAINNNNETIGFTAERTYDPNFDSYQDGVELYFYRSSAGFMHFFPEGTELISLNDNGEVLGYNRNSRSHFIFHNGYSKDIVFPAGTTLEINRALDMNNCGQIAAVLRNTATHQYGEYIIAPQFTAFIFDPDPVTSTGDIHFHDTGISPNEAPINRQRQCRLLQGIYTDPATNPEGCLIGEHAAQLFFNEESKSEMCSQTLIYNSSHTKRGFDAVNAYYHIDAAQRYVKEVLGVETGIAFPLTFYVDKPDSSEDIQPHYSIESKNIYFPDNYKDKTYAIGSHDGKVIYHETAHALMSSIAEGMFQISDPDSKIELLEKKALNEGLADVFATFAFADVGENRELDKKVGSWFIQKALDRENDSGIRREREHYKLYPNDLYDVEASPHETGGVVFHFFWEMADRLISISSNPGDENTRRGIRNKLTRLMLLTLPRMEKTQGLRGFGANIILQNGKPNQLVDSTVLYETLLKYGLVYEIKEVLLEKDTVAPGAEIKGHIVANTRPSLLGTTMKVTLDIPGNSSSPATEVVLSGIETQKGFLLVVPEDISEATEAILLFSVDNREVGRKPITLTPSTISFSLSEAALTGGKRQRGTVIISEPAPKKGLRLSLASSSPAAEVKEEIKIREGELVREFGIRTFPVFEDTEVTVSGTSLFGNFSKSFTVLPASLRRFGISPRRINNGDTVRVTVRFDKSPKYPTSVRFSSTSPLIELPNEMTIPEGEKRLDVYVTVQGIEDRSEAVIRVHHGDETLEKVVTLRVGKKG